MKKLLVLIALVLITTMSYSQAWFQVSTEYKFNRISRTSYSNEVGYNFNLHNETLFLSPSVDATYFSDGLATQSLIFECVTLTQLFPIEDSDFLPYVSVTGTHLDALLSPEVGSETVHSEKFGGSFQVGTGLLLTKHTQLFTQYRLFGYSTLLYGQLIQFGFMYTF